MKEKRKKLDPKDYNCRNDEGQFDMIKFEDNEFSVVKLFGHIQQFFLPPSDSGIDVDRIFRRHVSNKEMKVRPSQLCIFDFLCVYSLLLACLRLV